MKGKDASRLQELVAKYDVSPHSLNAAERRQLRKLIAREEGMGRNYRLVGNQKEKAHREQRLRGRHAARAERFA